MFAPRFVVGLKNTIVPFSFLSINIQKIVNSLVCTLVPVATKQVWRIHNIIRKSLQSKRSGERSLKFGFGVCSGVKHRLACSIGLSGVGGPGVTLKFRDKNDDLGVCGKESGSKRSFKCSLSKMLLAKTSRCSFKKDAVPALTSATTDFPAITESKALHNSFLSFSERFEFNLKRRRKLLFGWFMNATSIESKNQKSKIIIIRCSKSFVTTT